MIRWDESLFPIWPTSGCWKCHTVTIKSIGGWWNWYHDANWHSQWYQIAVILCIAGEKYIKSIAIWKNFLQRIYLVF